nr:MAG TPA: hypothetical protein [Caudoviricetes sp.]
MEESTSWIDLCEDSIEEIKSQLREDVDIEKHSHRLEVAAAALSFYKYTLYNASCPGMESFAAGEIRIKSDPNTAVKMAYRAWQEAKSAIADLIKDDNFVFERIAF